MSKVALEDGAGKVELHLPHPSGTVPIHFAGGASDISVLRPVGVPVRVAVQGRIGKLRVDGRSFEATDKEPFHSPGFAREADRYDIEVAGSGYVFVIATEPEIRHGVSTGRRSKLTRH